LGSARNLLISNGVPTFNGRYRWRTRARQLFLGETQLGVTTSTPVLSEIVGVTSTSAWVIITGAPVSESAQLPQLRCKIAFRSWALLALPLTEEAGICKSKDSTAVYRLIADAFDWMNAPAVLSLVRCDGTVHET
jgi:hypothetical protein